MRIIFLGTPEFAVGTLDELVRNGKDIVAVVTAPDKPAGRGRHLVESPVKTYALQKNIPVLQPSNLKDPQFLETLGKYRADLQIVVAFRMLPADVWDMPVNGTYNLHASLLPKYRGAAPINRAIMNGETETGVTTFKLRHEIDTGNILLQEKVKIGAEMNAGELHDLLKEKGAQLMLRTVNEIQRSVETGEPLHFLTQDETSVSHAPKIFRDDCRIDWKLPLKKIHDHVRGLSPYPGAFTIIKKGETTQTWKILKSVPEKIAHDFPFGTLITDNKTTVKICCAGGKLAIEELQAEGRKRMTVNEFLRGYRVPDGAIAI